MILNSSQVKTKAIKACVMVKVLTFSAVKIMILNSSQVKVKTKTIKACVMVKVLTFSAVDHDFEF